MVRASPAERDEYAATNEQEGQEDGPDRRHDRIGKEASHARRGLGGVGRLRDRLAARVQVREIEGEGRDDDDGQGEEQWDRPCERFAAKPEHTREKARGAHYD